MQAYKTACPQRGNLHVATARRRQRPPCPRGRKPSCCTLPGITATSPPTIDRRSFPMRKSILPLNIQTICSCGCWCEAACAPAFPSSFGVSGCQRLPHIRLGNAELSSNPRWRDARFEGCAHRVQLSLRQGSCDRFVPSLAPIFIDIESSLRRNRSSSAAQSSRSSS